MNLGRLLGHFIFSSFGFKRIMLRNTFRGVLRAILGTEPRTEDGYFDL